MGGQGQTAARRIRTTTSNCHSQSIRPDQGRPTLRRGFVARQTVADLVATDIKLKTLTKELAAAVRARGSHRWTCRASAAPLPPDRGRRRLCRSLGEHQLDALAGAQHGARPRLPSCAEEIREGARSALWPGDGRWWRTSGAPRRAGPTGWGTSGRTTRRPCRVGCAAAARVPKLAPWAICEGCWTGCRPRSGSA